ncbi:MAG: retropepsin-like aspartic protease [Planctomycetota bacterium]
MSLGKKLLLAPSLCVLAFGPILLAGAQDADSIRRRLETARSLIEEGRGEAALADLEAALAERPDPDTAALRAYCLFRLGRWRKALEISEADLHRYGGEPSILWALAPLRWRAGRTDEAASAAWAYLATGGFSTDLLWLVALHSCMGGDVAAAERILDQGLARAPGDEQLLLERFLMDWTMNPRRNLLPRLEQYEKLPAGVESPRFPTQPYRFWIERSQERELYSIRGDESPATRTADLGGSYPTLEVSISGKVGLALLDTGSAGNVIDRRVAERLGLPLGPENDILCLAGIAKGRAVLLPRLEIGSLLLEQVPATAIDFAGQNMGVPDLALILGSQLLLAARLAVVLNIDEGTITFLSSGPGSGGVAGGIAAPVWVVPRGGPYVQLTDLRGTPLGLALFDTGHGGVIFAPSVLERLTRSPLELLKNHEMQAMGDERTIRGKFCKASNVVFVFAGARGITREAVAGEFVPMSRFTELGFDVAGIIGYSVLRDLFSRVRIDLPARTLVWWRRDEPPGAPKEKRG